MKTITIQGHLRTETGKASTRQIRSQENVPGVIYGGAKEINFYASAKELKPLVYTSKFQLAEVNIDGEVHRAILKDLQFDKVKDVLTHIDLLELVEDKKLIADIPIALTGNAAGVKAGGKLIHKLKTIKVKCLPKDLKEAIQVDITNLEVNGNIRVEDIKTENMEIMNPPRIPVASIVMTRQLRQEEAAAGK
ncbi:50S ribosomal protein L25 [Haoranjiania flava]|uniref:Large ribosomal subunit protein bL25 n=1 Tax=Haoranjiania flava TaxID=1856322 RepID=A0AAE3LP73_9BACT|nr:50S ribosomal protein L25 [Haoranjiania flava]MCU7693210.1 50S ribosomal protein L25 [Haoranjiania flava]